MLLLLQLVHHPVLHFLVSYRPLFLLAGFNLQVECPIIDKTAAAESLGEQNLLLICRVDSHIVFCPKYRRKVLVNGVDERLKSLVQEKANESGITIEKMEVMPDQVHLFIRSKPTYAIHFAINQLKGYSSVCLRKEFPWLRSRLPPLWNRSYFVESVGHISEETVRKYIENQKKV